MRASEPQPPCPTSMYLINTLGWRWARRELLEQPQRSTWNTGMHVRNGNVRRWHSNKGRGKCEGSMFLSSQDVGASGTCRDRAPHGVRVSPFCGGRRQARSSMRPAGISRIRRGTTVGDGGDGLVMSKDGRPGLCHPEMTTAPVCVQEKGRWTPVSRGRSRVAPAVRKGRIAARGRLS